MVKVLVSQWMRISFFISNYCQCTNHSRKSIPVVVEACGEARPINGEWSVGGSTLFFRIYPPIHVYRNNITQGPS
jgi:hypothetical protein